MLTTRHLWKWRTARVPQAMAVIQMLSAPAEQSALYTNVSASKDIMAQGFRDTVMVSVLIFNFTDICSVGYFTILVVCYIIITNIGDSWVACLKVTNVNRNCIKKLST